MRRDFSASSVSTDEPLVVVLPDGKTVTGKLSTEGGKVEVATATAKEQVPLANVQVLRNSAEQKEYERYLHPGLTDLWAGYVDFGLATASGNAQNTSITTAFNAARATKTDKTTVYFNQIYAKAKLSGAPSQTTAQAIRGGIGYNRYVTNRLFVNVFNDYEYDKFQDLDLRFVLGGGLGYSVIKSEKNTLGLLAGLAYNRAKFTNITRNSAEGFWGDDWSYKLNGITSLTQSFRMFHNVSDPGPYRINFDLGLATTLRKWLSWQVTASDRFLSDPVLGRKRNDLILSTGFRVTFAR